MLVWLVVNLAILQMVCLITKLFPKWFNFNYKYIPAGNTHENGWTEEKYPFIYTRIDCSGSETRLNSCSPLITSNIQYCSNFHVVNLTCEGQYLLKFCV